MPIDSGSALNAPRGCLSKPIATPTSKAPERIVESAIVSALPPVAHPFQTLMNGSPLSPSSLTRVSASPPSRLPPNANWTSCQPMPASASARRAAWTACCRPETPSWRPNGWMPIPTIATPDIRPRL